MVNTSLNIYPVREPEHAHTIQSVFVHDMAKSPWDAPEDEFFIDARAAWYVVGHSLTGAMGSTLASFAEKTDAEAFSRQYGGKVITYTDIDHDVI